MSKLDWYDVDSDDDTPIPELPPLPLIKSASLPLLSSVDGMHSCDSTRTCTDDASEHSTSAAGSQRQESPFPSRRELPDQENQDTYNINDDNLPHLVENKLHMSNRFCFDDAAVLRKQQKRAIGDPIVCFIGNFPPNTSMQDLKDFVKSKGVIFTEIRLGPKKRPNSNGFGYVDLVTEEDQEKLLLHDGTEFRGRKIRIDQATKKPQTTSSKKKSTKTIKKRLQARNQYKNHKSVLSRKNSNVKYPAHLKLQRSHSEPHMRSFGHSTHRSRFFKNGRKAGTRSKGQKGCGKSPRKMKARSKKGGFSAFRTREEHLGRLVQ